MNKYAQIFIGGAGKSKETWENIEEKISLINPDGIIIGWAETPEIYEKIHSYTTERGIKCYLWLPVFSEWKAVLRQSDYILSNGSPSRGNPFTQEESFDFCCVSQRNNLDSLGDYFEKTFYKWGFDGVFLDRIRYPSFAAGIDTFFGCRCKNCQKKYAEYEISNEEFEDYLCRIKSNIADSNCDNPLGLGGYSNGEWSFEDPQTEKLLLVKCKIINDSISFLAKKLRTHVEEIGLDLFAPFMSVFVGQSYQMLPEHADFIKPMLYRYTYTPAALGFELDQMIKAVSTDSTIKNRGSFIRSLLNVPDDGNMSALFQSELAALKKIGKKVTIGIESHTLPDRPPVEVKQIENNLELINKAGFQDITACWNVLDSTTDNLRVIFK